MTRRFVPTLPMVKLGLDFLAMGDLGLGDRESALMWNSRPRPIPLPAASIHKPVLTSFSSAFSSDDDSSMTLRRVCSDSGDVLGEEGSLPLVSKSVWDSPRPCEVWYDATVLCEVNRPGVCWASVNPKTDFEKINRSFSVR